MSPWHVFLSERGPIAVSTLTAEAPYPLESPRASPLPLRLPRAHGGVLSPDILSHQFSSNLGTLGPPPIILGAFFQWPSSLQYVHWSLCRSLQVGEMLTPPPMAIQQPAVIGLPLPHPCAREHWTALLCKEDLGYSPSLLIFQCLSVVVDFLCYDN